MSPFHAAPAPRFKAPRALAPPPVTLNGSLLMAMAGASSKVAPLLTVVPPEVPPSAPVWLASSVPSFTLTVPVKVLLRLNSSTPGPVLIKPPVPVPSSMNASIVTQPVTSNERVPPPRRSLPVTVFVPTEVNEPVSVSPTPATRLALERVMDVTVSENKSGRNAPLLLTWTLAASAT